LSLHELITKRIQQSGGAISVAEYMQLCLAHPDYGYYMCGDPLGEKGDFTTAPEISQLFGEMLGAWLAHQWQVQNSPEHVTLVELGPGRGTLAADMLRATRHVSGFHAALDIHLVETSPSLTSIQQQRLKDSHPRISWHAALNLPPKPLLLVANEFFDALPIRQFAADGTERMVVLADDVLAFSFPDEAVAREVCEPGQEIAAAVARHIAQFGGAALFIDYGYVGGSAGDTLQALKAHRYHRVLCDPGQADVTAHVDFAVLGEITQKNGAKLAGPISQGQFLTQMGIGLRLRQLGEKSDEKQQKTLISGVERLVSPQEMGELFKIMAILPENYQKTEGFDV